MAYVRKFCTDLLTYSFSLFMSERLTKAGNYKNTQYSLSLSVWYWYYNIIWLSLVYLYWYYNYSW